MKPTLAIAGATGFIGRWFIEQYKDKYHIIGLSRRNVEAHPDLKVEWRQVDLFSVSNTEAALAGADYAMYLVHSMNPSTRLNQGSFDDTDLLLADNFSRAAEVNQLKHIVYIGGIVPDMPKNKLSQHLRSRLEVEETLGSRSTPLTTLRAGLIIGPGGSSFRIIENLVKRLPVMACPDWCLTDSQPLALRDILRVIDHCLGHEPCFNTSYEVGGPDVLTYMDLLKMTGEVMGLKRYIFSLAIIPAWFSKNWVGIFSGASTKFAAPLVESLRYDMTLKNGMDIPDLYMDPTPIRKAVERAVNEKETVPKNPKAKKRAKTKERNTVRSYQRLPNPENKTADWIAQRYETWMPRFLRYLVKARFDEKENLLTFYLSFYRKPMLMLKLIPERSSKERQLFYIVGGYLVKRKDLGWLEFRSILDGQYVIAAIHEFVPRLPWVIYLNTQARAHLWVMNSFGRYLKRRGNKRQRRLRKEEKELKTASSKG